MGGVVFVDQLLGVDADRTRDAADVATGVEVATARGEVITFDAPDDRLPDAGSLTDLRNGETGFATGLRQGITDAHAAPPLCLWHCCCPERRRRGSWLGEGPEPGATLRF